MYQERFPEAPVDAYTACIGRLIYYRYINPAIMLSLPVSTLVSVHLNRTFLVLLRHSTLCLRPLMLQPERISPRSPEYSRKSPVAPILMMIVRHTSRSTILFWKLLEIFPPGCLKVSVITINDVSTDILDYSCGRSWRWSSFPCPRIPRCYGSAKTYLYLTQWDIYHAWPTIPVSESNCNSLYSRKPRF